MEKRKITVNMGLYFDCNGLEINEAIKELEQFKKAGCKFLVLEEDSSDIICCNERIETDKEFENRKLLFERVETARVERELKQLAILTKKYKDK